MCAHEGCCVSAEHRRRALVRPGFVSRTTGALARGRPGAGVRFRGGGSRARAPCGVRAGDAEEKVLQEGGGQLLAFDLVFVGG